MLWCRQERAQRAQILDVETQLNQMKAECMKIKHDKEEVQYRTGTLCDNTY